MWITSESLGWRTILVATIFSCGVIALSSGVVLSDGGDLDDFTAVLFCVFCQFLLAGSEFGVPTSGPPWAVNLMWFVYFSAPLTSIALGAERLLLVLEKDNWKISSIKNHYVIFGHETITEGYLRRLRSTNSGDSVIVVDDRFSAATKKDLSNRFDLTCIDGSVAMHTLAEDLRLEHAKKICIFSGAEFETLSAATSFLTKWPALKGKIIVQNSDLRFLRSLKNTSLSKRCILFNSYNLAAATLVSSALTNHFKNSPERDLVVIAGYGRFGQSMLMLLNEMAAPSIKRVVIIDTDIEKQVSIAREQSVYRDDIPVTAITGDVSHPELWAKVTESNDLKEGSPTIILATGNDKLNLNTAITLKNRYPNLSIFTRTQEPNLFVNQVATEEGFHGFSIDQLVEAGLPQDWID